MLIKSLEMGIYEYFHTGGVLGNMGERSFPRVFGRRVKFLFYQKKFHDEFEKVLEMVNSHYKGSHWEPGGGSFTGTF
jgi:hypothetical protein